LNLVHASRSPSIEQAPSVPNRSIRTGSPSNAAVDATNEPTAPEANRIVAAATSSTSIRSCAAVVTWADTVETSPARCSSRSTVWMP
jgi:hypothetical protein